MERHLHGIVLSPDKQVTLVVLLLSHAQSMVPVIMPHNSVVLLELHRQLIRDHVDEPPLGHVSVHIHEPMLRIVVGIIQFVRPMVPVIILLNSPVRQVYLLQK